MNEEPTLELNIFSLRFHDDNYNLCTTSIQSNANDDDAPKLELLAATFLPRFVVMVTDDIDSKRSMKA